LNTLRAFIAVDLPPPAERAVAALCTGLEGVRWAKAGQLHITLRFLGATPEERLADLDRRLATLRAAPFDLALHGVGVFPPNTRRPRVLWLGVTPERPLRALKDAVDCALAAEGSPYRQEPKQDFSPHLTLARFTRGADPALPRFLAQHAEYRGVEWQVTSFRLYKSTLAPAGSVHEMMETYPLAPTCREG